MKLVVDSEGITDYPEILNTVELRDADRSLSGPEKRRLATEVLFNQAYYAKKDQIRANMKKSLAEVEKLTQDAETSLARKHIFLNIIPSILPKVKIILCNLFSATILVEVVFEWPGTGIWISTAVEHSDNAVLETAIFVLVIIFLLVNTVIDIMGEVFFPEKRRITLNI